MQHFRAPSGNRPCEPVGALPGTDDPRPLGTSCAASSAAGSWARGYNDYLVRNGLSINYITYVFENGDKMYVTTRTMGQADSAGKRATSSVGEITGGTGKFVGIKGISRATGISQGQAGLNESQTELEYWFVK